jgi:hypothetical protein
MDSPYIRFSDCSNPYLGTGYSINDPTLIFGLEPVAGKNRSLKALMDKEASPPFESNRHVDKTGSPQHAESYDSDSTRDSRESNTQPMIQDEMPRVTNLDYFDIDPMYPGS